jgi:signal transduction histidine kinase
MRFDAALRRRPLVASGTDRLGRSVVQAHAALVLAFALMAAMPLASADGISDSGLVARWGVVASFGVVAVWMLTSGERLGQLLLVLVTLTAAAPALLREHIPGETAAGMLISSAVLLGARVLVPVAAVINALVAWSPFAVATAVGAHVAPQSIGVEDYALATAMGIAAVGFVNALESLARHASETAAFTRTRRRELLRREAEAEAVEHAQRVLHDDVLGTLTFIADGSVRDVDAVRAHCRQTAASITHVLGATGVPRDLAGVQPRRGLTHAGAYGDMLSRVLELAPVTVEIEATADALDAIALLPQSRADALERAVMEALRNVAKHSGESSAAVRVRVDRQRVQLTVRDEGVGIAADAPPGFGLAQSIRGAMAAAGGDASIESAPGHGTSLTLRMPRGRSAAGRIERTYADTVSGFGLLPLATRSVALPMVLVWTLIGGYQSLVAPNPAVSLLVTIGWGILSLLVLNRVEHRAPTRLWVLGVASAVSLLQAAGLVLMEPGALLDYRSWSVGFSAAPLVVLVFVLPVRAGVVILASQPAIVLAAAWLSPELSSNEFPFGAVNAPITAPLATLLLGVLVRRTTRRAAERTAAATSLEHALLLESARAETTALYFEYSRDRVRPWLEAVARGEIDPGSAVARGQAQLLAMAARDDLYAPGFFDESLRERVARFRDEGGTVELRAGLAAGGSGRSVGRLLGDLLPLSSGHRIIVSPATEAESRVRISVVPPPPGRDLAQVIEHLGPRLSADVDDFRAVLLVQDIPVSG